MMERLYCLFNQDDTAQKCPQNAYRAKTTKGVLQPHKCMGMAVMKHLLKCQSQLKLRTRKWNHSKILPGLTGEGIGQPQGSPAEDCRWTVQSITGRNYNCNETQIRIQGWTQFLKSSIRVFSDLHLIFKIKFFDCRYISVRFLCKCNFLHNLRHSRALLTHEQSPKHPHGEHRGSEPTA